MKILITLFITAALSLSAAAQSKIVPLIDAKVGGLLGGVENGKYFDAKTTFGKLKGADKFLLFNIGGKSGELDATIESPGDPCEDFYYVKSDKEDEKGLGIGAGINWNPLPRTAKAVNLQDKTYLRVVADILRGKGLPKSKAVIEQAVKIDLDGDGTDEVLLTASAYGGKISPEGKAGNYSFVLLRKVVAGKVKNIFLAEEYVKKSVQFGVPTRFEVSGIADLNGDGKMEIVVFGEYYEGSGSSVYEIKGDKPIEIKELSAACGV